MAGSDRPFSVEGNARLEQMAEPGGVLVSGKIHDEVAGKIGVALEDRGEQQVKNIARPVRVCAANGAIVGERPPPISE